MIHLAMGYASGNRCGNPLCGGAIVPGPGAIIGVPARSSAYRLATLAARRRILQSVLPQLITAVDELLRRNNHLRCEIVRDRTVVADLGGDKVFAYKIQRDVFVPRRGDWLINGQCLVSRASPGGFRECRSR